MLLVRARKAECGSEWEEGQWTVRNCCRHRKEVNRFSVQLWPQEGGAVCSCCWEEVTRGARPLP